MLNVKRRQAGDTIVEVMIVLAVLGFAISLCYTTANRSLLNARQAQETSIAAEYAQSQVELLRIAANNPPLVGGSPNSAYIFTDPLFCMNNNTVERGFVKTQAALANSTDLNDYPANCRKDNLYGISVHHELSKDTFTIKVFWSDVLGEGNDSVTLVYRVHET